MKLHRANKATCNNHVRQLSFYYSAMQSALKHHIKYRENYGEMTPLVAMEWIQSIRIKRASEGFQGFVFFQVEGKKLKINLAAFI